MSIVRQGVRWIKEAETARAALHNKPHSGCMCTAVMPHNIHCTDEVICGNCLITTVNYAPPYQLVKAVKSFAIPRSLLIGCQECWQMHTETRTAITADLSHQYDTECEGFLSQGMKPGSTIFNLNPRHN